MSRTRKRRDAALIADLRAALAASQVHVDGLTREVARRRTPEQIDRLIAISVDAALGEVARQQAGIAEPIATEARGAGLRGAIHLYRPSRTAHEEDQAATIDATNSYDDEGCEACAAIAAARHELHVEHEARERQRAQERWARMTPAERAAEIRATVVLARRRVELVRVVEDLHRVADVDRGRGDHEVTREQAGLRSRSATRTLPRGSPRVYVAK